MIHKSSKRAQEQKNAKTRRKLNLWNFLKDDALQPTGKISETIEINS